MISADFLRRRVFSVMSCIGLLLVGVCPVLAQALDEKNERVVQAMHAIVEKTNKERAAHGLAPLRLNPALVRAATQHACDMAKFGYFDHCTPNAPTGTENYADYASEQQYPGLCGENLYHGTPRPADILTGWMNSVKHRENLLEPRYNEIGIGLARGRDYYDTFCVQFLGRQENIYPLVINREAYTTTAPTVQLYLYGAERMTQMRFSTDGINFTAWENFRSQLSFTLSQELGPHTITVEMTDGNRVYRSDDTIQLISR